MIDGATNMTTTVGAGPSRAVAVNPVTNKIYVANNTNGTVTVIDGATNSPPPSRREITPGGGGEPGHQQDLRRQQRSDNVTVIDGATNTTSTVTVGTIPLPWP